MKNSKRPLSLRKRKGIYHGEFVFDFLKQKQFFIICHANSMQLETYLPLRTELEKIDFSFKFLKRKTVLNYFDKHSISTFSKKNDEKQTEDSTFLSKKNALQKFDKNLFNGSIAIIYPKKQNNVHIKIFEIVENAISKSMQNSNIANQKLIMLGFFLNDFYLISKGKKIFNKNALKFQNFNNANMAQKMGHSSVSIEFVSNILKVSSIFLTLTSLLQKFNKINQPWTKILPIFQFRELK